MNTDKRPLILLHGALGSIEHWTELAPLLSDFDLHMFNFAGHGGKVCQEAFSIDMFAHDLLLYMDHNGIEVADIFGFSMGGYVALRFAQDHSDRVGRIVTLGTKFNWTPEVAEKQFSLLNPEKILEKVPHFAEALQERHAPLDWKDVVTKTSDMLMRLGNGEAVDFTKSTFENEVTIMVGDQDRVVKFGEAVEVAEALPNGTFLPLPGAPNPIELVPKTLLATELKRILAA